MRIHHRFVEARVGDDAFAVDLHVADKAHAVDLRHQRADAVGQRFRQHRHHEAREVHRGRALLRFIVQRRAGTDIVGDVGNGDHQAEAIGVRLAVHRVVEVLGVLAIDGDQRRAAQVDAVTDHRRLDHQRHRRGFVQHFLRELERQFVAVNRGLHHQRCGQLVAEHSDDAADRRTAAVRCLGQFADDQLAIARTAGLVWRHLHVALDALVIGHHVVDAHLDAEAADQAGHAALQHAGDAAFATAAVIDAGDTGQHLVAVHHLAHFVRRQEQIVAALDRAQEAEAFRIGNHHAGDQVQRLDGSEAAAAVLHQLAIADHGAEPARQCLGTVRCGQAQARAEFFSGLRPFAALQQGQDGLAAGDGLFVLFCFAGRIGIVDHLARRRQLAARRGARCLCVAAASTRRRCATFGQCGQPARQRLARLVAAGRAGLGALVGGFTAGLAPALAWFFGSHRPPW
ncbi:hypothetical protein D3C81_457430 [compost metagenome]